MDRIKLLQQILVLFDVDNVFVYVVSCVRFKNRRCDPSIQREKEMVLALTESVDEVRLSA